MGPPELYLSLLGFACWFLYPIPEGPGRVPLWNGASTAIYVMVSLGLLPNAVDDTYIHVNVLILPEFLYFGFITSDPFILIINDAALPNS